MADQFPMTAYGFSQPLLDVFPAPIVSKRNPTTQDRARIGTLWINTLSNSPFVLTSVIDNEATWVPLGFGSLTFNTQSGEAIPAASLLNVFGSGSTTTSGSGNTITINSSGGGGGMLLTKFTSSGTWTKNASTVNVTVIGWNGGQGGGSGARGASTASGGGGAGGTGGIFYYQAPGSFFGATETVTIGAGGNGGAAITSNNTSGNNGGDSGLSLFGNVTNLPTAAVAGGGSSVSGGNGGGSGNSLLYIGQISSTAISSGVGGTGGLAAAGTQGSLQGDVPNNDIAATGGGGAGGADSGNKWAGGNGGDIAKWNDALEALTLILAGGAGGIEGGVSINGANGNPGVITGGLVTGGSGGGGGGGQSSGLVAGNGGTGGIPGGGGGGGGGSLNGTNSGAGGNGARGEVWVLEFFS